MYNLKISPCYPDGYQCAIADYDAGDVIGFGDSIPEAIENWLQWESHKTDVAIEEIKYKWSGEELFNLNPKDFQQMALETECFLRKSGISTLLVWFKHKATAALVTIDFVKDIPAAIAAFIKKHPDFKHDYTLGTTIYFQKQ